jgi:hypothetical protein
MGILPAMVRRCVLLGEYGFHAWLAESCDELVNETHPSISIIATGTIHGSSFEATATGSITVDEPVSK